MKTYLTIILTATFGICYSQNYSLLNTSRQCLFNEGNYCLHIDSISTINNDTSYFNYRQISGNEGCSKYSHTSWLGKFVTKKNNNVWKFVSANDDTLIIKPNLIASAKWYAGNVFSVSDTARIDSIYQTTFLGITDSIKSITVYGCTNSIYCFHQILVSQNFGLIKFFDLQYSNTPLILAGITNPNVGLQNLSGADVYDFQVGDEYHTVYHNSSQITQGVVANNKYAKHIILSTFTNASGLTVIDSIYRVSEDIHVNFDTNPISSTITSSDTSIVDTIFYHQSLITQFDKLSGENILDSMVCSFGNARCVDAFSQGITDGFQTKTTTFFGCEFVYNGANNCLSECIVDGIPNHFYTKKMGGVYNHLIPNWNLGFGTEYYPVYHKRGSVEEGTPLDFLGILLGVENKQNDTQINLYPNPANDIITISNSTGFKEIEIYNSIGLLVLKTQLQKINISYLADGFYLIKIIKNDNTFVEKRFVKQ